MLLAMTSFKDATGRSLQGRRRRHQPPSVWCSGASGRWRRWPSAARRRAAAWIRRSNRSWVPGSARRWYSSRPGIHCPSTDRGTLSALPCSHGCSPASCTHRSSPPVSPEWYRLNVKFPIVEIFFKWLWTNEDVQLSLRFPGWFAECAPPWRRDHSNKSIRRIYHATTRSFWTTEFRCPGCKPSQPVPWWSRASSWYKTGES